MRIGGYEIVSLLGAGGMGEVYRARDTKLGRSVAVKVLPSVVARHPDRIARFEREARTLATLNHPHIAALFGMEQAGERHFLVMELGQRFPHGHRHSPIERSLTRWYVGRCCLPAPLCHIAEDDRVRDAKGIPD